MNRELTNIEKQKVIDEKTKQILSLLGIKKSFRVLNQLASTLKLYKYIFQKADSSFAKTIPDINTDDKNDRYLHDLYVGLTHNPGTPTTNTIVFKHLLMHSIAESEVVLLKSTKSGRSHLANIVKLGKEYYYFDPTLERSIFDDDTWEENQKTLCCAAIGKNDDYFKLYKPIGALPDDMNMPLKQLPDNISEDSMSKSLVNEIASLIPDYSRTGFKEQNEDYGER